MTEILEGDQAAVVEGKAVAFVMPVKHTGMDIEETVDIRVKNSRMKSG